MILKIIGIVKWENDDISSLFLLRECIKQKLFAIMQSRCLYIIMQKGTFRKWEQPWCWHGIHSRVVNHKKVFISHSWKCIAKNKANEKCFCLSIVMFCLRFFCWGCSSNCIKYINVDDIKMCNKILCGFYYPYECIELFLALFRLSLLSSVSSINALCLLLLLYVPDNDLWFYIKAKMNGTNGGINNFMTLSIHINILHFSHDNPP